MNDSGKKRAIKATKKLVKLQQKAFDKTFSLVAKVQDGSERAMKDTVGKAEWMPREGKDAVEEWMKLVRGGRKDFEATMDKSFSLLNGFLDRAEKEAAAGKKGSKKKAAAKKKSKAKAKPKAKKKAAPKKKRPAKKKAAS